MVEFRMRSLACIATILLLAACSRAAAPGPADPGQEATRHRAALALLTVENSTSHRLRIAFRPAVGPGGTIVVGAVAADATAEMAPIPAGEPIILMAIGPAQQRLELPPRSFDLDARWTWRIPADAGFTPATEPSR